MVKAAIYLAGLRNLEFQAGRRKHHAENKNYKTLIHFIS